MTVQQDGGVGVAARALSVVLGIDAVALRADTPLADLGVDSIALVQWADVAEELDARVRIDDADLVSATTLGQLAAAVGRSR